MYRFRGRPTVFIPTPGSPVAAIGPVRAGEPGLAKDVGRSVFVAAVLGTDGILFTAAAESEELCWFQVAAYVADRLDTRLWPERATRVRALLDVGDYAAASELYFEHVGERWDEEWLVAAPIGISARGVTRWSNVDPREPDRSSAA